MPGVPWKSAAGTKRSSALDGTTSALVTARPDVGTSIQLVPASLDSSQVPCAAV
ncbi:MAG: hypothetical protein U5J97_11620 [Trueperaceae bacterium]|nr:hypothetical protein [Trueperaceae bacterium]